MLKKYFSLDKIALPVPLPKKYRERMMDKTEPHQVGVLTEHPEGHKMPNVGVRDVKRITEENRLNMSPSLPRVYVFSKDNIVEIEGGMYYVVFVEQSKDLKRDGHKDGKIIAIDVATGEAETFSFDQYSSKIQKHPDVRRETLERINKEIAEWNGKIDKIDKMTGVTALPLQMGRARNRIDQRINTLQAQIDAIEKQKQNPLSGFSAYNDWLQFLREGIQKNEFSLQDTFDTLLFLYKRTPDQLAAGLESGEIKVPPELKNALIQIARAEASGVAEKSKKREIDQEQREQRIEDDLPEFKEPGLEGIQPMTEEQLPSSYEKATTYHTLEYWWARKFAQLYDIKRDLKELTGIKEALTSMVGYMAALEKGQLSKQYLLSPEGQQDVGVLKEFLNKAKAFLKRYQDSLIDESGGVSQRIFGRTGTIGNAEIFISLARLYNVLRLAFMELTPSDVKPYPATGFAPSIEEPAVQPVTEGVQSSYFDLNKVIKKGKR